MVSTWFELPAGYSGGFYENYKAHIALRLHLVPMLTRKLLSLPFGIDHPLWIDCDDLDIDYHVRQVTLPGPGSKRQLEDMVARLHSSFLDRSRPLWEFYVIDGLESGHVGVYTKIHHAAMDGATSLQLVTAMHDTTPMPRDPPPATLPHKDELAPGNVVSTVIRHVLQREIRTAQFLPELLKTWCTGTSGHRHPDLPGRYRPAATRAQNPVQRRYHQPALLCGAHPAPERREMGRPAGQSHGE